VLTLINAFDQAPTPESVWDAVGDLLAILRSNGVTVPFNDVVIALVAIMAGVELWTRDHQFQLIQCHEPRLKLFQEPP
jgi:predicted nucleic acid-binding protein